MREKLFIVRHITKAVIKLLSRKKWHETMWYRQEALTGMRGMVQTVHNSVSLLKY